MWRPGALSGPCLLWTTRGVAFLLAGPLASKHFPPPNGDSSGPQQLCGKSLGTRDTGSSGGKSAVLDSALQKAPLLPHPWPGRGGERTPPRAAPSCGAVLPGRRFVQALVQTFVSLCCLSVVLPIETPLTHSFIHSATMCEPSVGRACVCHSSARLTSLEHERSDKALLRLPPGSLVSPFSAADSLPPLNMYVDPQEAVGRAQAEPQAGHEGPGTGAALGLLPRWHTRLPSV